MAIPGVVDCQSALPVPVGLDVDCESALPVPVGLDVDCESALPVPVGLDVDCESALRPTAPDCVDLQTSRSRRGIGDACVGLAACRWSPRPRDETGDPGAAASERAYLVGGGIRIGSPTRRRVSGYCGFHL